MEFIIAFGTEIRQLLILQGIPHQIVRIQLWKICRYASCYEPVVVNAEVFLRIVAPVDHDVIPEQVQKPPQSLKEVDP